MATAPLNVEDALRATRPIIEHFLRTHSVVQKNSLIKKEYNDVDIESIYEAIKNAFRAAGIERFEPFNERDFSTAEYDRLVQAKRDFINKVGGSFPLTDNRSIIARCLAGLLFHIQRGMVRIESYDISKTFETILTGTWFTVTPLPTSSGGAGRGARAATASTASVVIPCVVCRKPATERCARCVESAGLEGWYCGKECQTIDWKERGHKAYHVAAAKANKGGPTPPSERKSRKARRTRKHRS